LCFADDNELANKTKFTASCNVLEQWVCTI
jgi:hypothetical protein